MEADELAIREVHCTCIDAVNGGDLVRLLAMIADDGVLLNPGQAPIGRDGWRTPACRGLSYGACGSRVKSI